MSDEKVRNDIFGEVLVRVGTGMRTLDKPMSAILDIIDEDRCCATTESICTMLRTDYKQTKEEIYKSLEILRAIR
jgi:hypothetical protein